MSNGRVGRSYFPDVVALDGSREARQLKQKGDVPGVGDRVLSYRKEAWKF